MNNTEVAIAIDVKFSTWVDSNAKDFTAPYATRRQQSTNAKASQGAYLQSSDLSLNFGMAAEVVTT